MYVDASEIILKTTCIAFHFRLHIAIYFAILYNLNKYTKNQLHYTSVETCIELF